ncbi:hypothetical protein JBL43_00035 [Aureibaculum sp. A20]|uniref:SGNH/GDSL hydrolase family protein n=1 Tax=Aureibaculum flavum TaxID=2795986 RepID=A0ABS0WKV0_9FLAO|nr:hypothetical protein [Aureibaculum flavum]MBJ2172605.1 hypothetical protein [Aureibaculum flavum]
MQDNSFILNFNIIKKIVLNISLVFIVVGIFDFLIGNTLRFFYFKESSGLHYRTTYAIDSTQADVLIFGASTANHHYVPQVFENSLNMTYYNTGRDGQGILYQLAVLKSILKRYKPSVIILDHTARFNNSEKDFERLSALLPYYKDHKEIRAIIEKKSSFEQIKLLSNIYPYNSNMLTIALGNLEFNKKRKPDIKGYVELNGIWEGALDSINNKGDINNDIIKIRALEEFIELSKNSGANLFIIKSPVFKISPNNIDSLLTTISLKHKIPFYNFKQDSIFLNNPFLFKDLVHLNKEGATVISNIICDSIKQHL